MCWDECDMTGGRLLQSLSLVAIGLSVGVWDMASNRSISQIPQGTSPIMHQFLTEMCTNVHISITKWCILGYFVWCIKGFVGWQVEWIYCLVMCWLNYELIKILISRLFIFNGIQVSCNALWTHLTSGKFHNIPKATDSPFAQLSQQAGCAMSLWKSLGRLASWLLLQHWPLCDPTA